MPPSSVRDAPGPRYDCHPIMHGQFRQSHPGWALDKLSNVVAMPAAVAVGPYRIATCKYPCGAIEGSV
ncbi:hypothetical protein MPL1032_30407 [Mesorhizobium plurifarium]|uniref:Uncharacterized protein n=1 Tax=Mesorhizobium plurifarium TaxID=69974 RepID=A0A0K2W3K5_MESPL|nr:hypothetical protein MPL1032_30407 [Mesorhizobium plurifarium]